MKRFLKGVLLLNPPQIYRFPSWKLNLVLRALHRPPFEALASCLVKELMFKMLFLIAITSAHRVSELRALSVNKEFCIFQQDKVVLRLDPTFVPKVNSHFHRSQDIVLPSFCRDPKNSGKRESHCLDVRRALSFYIDRTKDIRKTDYLSPLIQPPWDKGSLAAPLAGGFESASCWFMRAVEWDPRRALLLTPPGARLSLPLIIPFHH